VRTARQRSDEARRIALLSEMSGADVMRKLMSEMSEMSGAGHYVVRVALRDGTTQTTALGLSPSLIARRPAVACPDGAAGWFGCASDGRLRRSRWPQLVTARKLPVRSCR
jgi:hypothetical protein